MNGIASPTAPSGSGADGCPGPGVTSDTEDLPAFASTAQEVNYYARFLQFLVTGLPSARDRAVGAQWSLVLTAGPPQPGVHDEYLKQLLVCCTVGRLLGVFSSPPASSWLPPLPEHHSVAWLTKAAHALRERERRQGAGDPSERQQQQQQQPADEAEKANEKAGEAGRGAPAPTDNAGEAQGQRRAADGDEPEPVPAPPVQAEVSAGGTQYLAVQDGGGSADESHFYYAFSTEPLPHWVGAVDADLGETSHGTQDHKTGGSGSVPWLSSHEGEGLDWLLANPGFLSLPSAERPASDLWQEASPELQAQAGQRPRGDAFDDLPPTPFAALQHQDPDAHAPGGYVWVEDEFGGLTEVPVETLAAEEDEDFGEDDADEDEWRPAEQIYPSNAPIAVAALALPVGQRPQQRPWGMAAAAWPGGGGGASYEDSQYPSSSYGTYEAGGWFPGGGAGGGGWDSLGQSYGSAETTEPTHAGSSLGAGGWPYRYSLSRSQSAPATSASEGASTLNEGMLSGSAGSEASASFRDVYYDETHYAPQPPATPRPSRRRRAARDTDLDLSDADGSLFKPVTTGRHVTRQPTRPQPQRALSDSDMFNARQQVRAAVGVSGPEMFKGSFRDQKP
ncbi:hypothetical protein ONE63_007436 [Megalurothrips usitatus]|uniref:Uncharacterized protein n=1 Tax=Megalurothrips usitatus TaxID=439358 RepID=A0AAV7XSK0_9NEOP|nr:hypothetical protein ONE63_007436 [Megalurothrips usitatus]